MTRGEHMALTSAARQHVRLAREIVEARARLYRLAARYPLRDRRVLAASRALDRLILEAQRGMGA